MDITGITINFIECFLRYGIQDQGPVVHNELVERLTR